MFGISGLAGWYHFYQHVKTTFLQTVYFSKKTIQTMRKIKMEVKPTGDFQPVYKQQFLHVTLMLCWFRSSLIKSHQELRQNNPHCNLIIRENTANSYPVLFQTLSSPTWLLNNNYSCFFRIKSYLFIGYFNFSLDSIFLIQEKKKKNTRRILQSLEFSIFISLNFLESWGLITVATSFQMINIFISLMNCLSFSSGGLWSWFVSVCQERILWFHSMHRTNLFQNSFYPTVNCNPLCNEGAFTLYGKK